MPGPERLPSQVPFERRFDMKRPLRACSSVYSPLFPGGVQRPRRRGHVSGPLATGMCVRGARHTGRLLSSLDLALPGGFVFAQQVRALWFRGSGFRSEPDKSIRGVFQNLRSRQEGEKWKECQLLWWQWPLASNWPLEVTLGEGKHSDHLSLRGTSPVWNVLRTAGAGAGSRGDSVRDSPVGDHRC